MIRTTIKVSRGNKGFTWTPSIGIYNIMHSRPVRKLVHGIGAVIVCACAVGMVVVGDYIAQCIW